MIKTSIISDENAVEHKELLAMLIDRHLYNDGGSMIGVWNRAYNFNKKTIISVAYDCDTPVGVSLLHHKNFYGWEWHNLRTFDTYGSLGAYVLPSLRKHGIARRLIDATMSCIEDVGVTAYHRLQPVIKHLSNVVIVGP